MEIILTEDEVRDIITTHLTSKGYNVQSIEVGFNQDPTRQSSLPGGQDIPFDPNNIFGQRQIRTLSEVFISPTPGQGLPFFDRPNQLNQSNTNALKLIFFTQVA